MGSARRAVVSSSRSADNEDLKGDLFLTFIKIRNAVRPERVEREVDGVEVRERDRVAVGKRGQRHPALLPQPERLQRPGVGIDEPQAGDSLAGVDPRFLVARGVLRLGVKDAGGHLTRPPCRAARSGRPGRSPLACAPMPVASLSVNGITA